MKLKTDVEIGYVTAEVEVTAEDITTMLREALEDASEDDLGRMHGHEPSMPAILSAFNLIYRWVSCYCDADIRRMNYAQRDTVAAAFRKLADRLAAQAGGAANG